MLRSGICAFKSSPYCKGAKHFLLIPLYYRYISYAYISGLAVSRLRCIPSLKKCHDNSNCPSSYRCYSGRCCRRFVKPTLTCPSTMIPDGFCFNGRCPAGYVCFSRRCCKPRITSPFSCPLNMVSDGFCFNGRCPAGYNCIDKRCCKPRISQIGTCPVGMKYTGKCSASTPYCKVGSTCLSGSCCSKSVIAMGCPAGYTKVGTCFGEKSCPFWSSCKNNVCCRRIFPPEIPQRKYIMK